MKYELLQPWSTFVMKTRLPLPVFDKMLKLTDEIVENNVPEKMGAGEMEEQFLVELFRLKEERLLDYFEDVAKKYVIEASCQSQPFNKEAIESEEWLTQISRMWINSQKDNEYFPIHKHTRCSMSSVMYLKIPEYLPSRNHNTTEGAIEFTGNSSMDQIWGVPTLPIQPRVGDFFIFSSDQHHCVYPFRTPDGTGERRSVSFNALFTTKKEDAAMRLKNLKG